MVTDAQARGTSAYLERLETETEVSPGEGGELLGALRGDCQVSVLNAELAPFRILTGIEVDIFEDGSLDQLDVVVASAHSKLQMPADAMTQRLVTAVSNPSVDILGHCTNRKLTGGGRSASRFDPEIVFAACDLFSTAVEVNCRPDRLDPPDELLALAWDYGCWVSINSDAHAPGQLEWLGLGCAKAARAGVTPERVLNALELEALRGWTEDSGRGVP